MLWKKSQNSKYMYMRGIGKQSSEGRGRLLRQCDPDADAAVAEEAGDVASHVQTKTSVPRSCLWIYNSTIWDQTATKHGCIWIWTSFFLIGHIVGFLWSIMAVIPLELLMQVVALSRDDVLTLKNLSAVSRSLHQAPHARLFESLQLTNSRMRLEHLLSL